MSNNPNEPNFWMLEVGEKANSFVTMLVLAFIGGFMIPAGNASDNTTVTTNTLVPSIIAALVIGLIGWSRYCVAIDRMVQDLRYNVQNKYNFNVQTYAQRRMVAFKEDWKKSWKWAQDYHNSRVGNSIWRFYGALGFTVITGICEATIERRDVAPGFTAFWFVILVVVTIYNSTLAKVFHNNTYKDTWKVDHAYNNPDAYGRMADVQQREERDRLMQEQEEQQRREFEQWIL